MKNLATADMSRRHPLFMRIAVSVCLVCMLAYSAIYAYLLINQRSLLYSASKNHISPEKAGFIVAREIILRTQDGEQIVAWYAPPEKGKPLLLFFHGKGGALDHRAARLIALSEGGNGVLAIDWRGFGGSTGAPTQQGLLNDALAAYDFALSTGMKPQQIVLVGESLGTGVAIWLAGEKPVAGLLLDSPYSSIADVAADRYWMFPTRSIIADAFPAEDWIRRVKTPIFAIHGVQDRVIPIGFATKLLANAPEPKIFIPVADSAHVVLGKPDIMQKARAWIAAITETKSSP